MELTKEMRTAFAEDIRAKASRVYELITEVAIAIEGGHSTGAEMKDYGKYALPMPDRRRVERGKTLKSPYTTSKTSPRAFMLWTNLVDSRGGNERNHTHILVGSHRRAYLRGSRQTLMLSTHTRSLQFCGLRGIVNNRR